MGYKADILIGVVIDSNCTVSDNGKLFKITGLVGLDFKSMSAVKIHADSISKEVRYTILTRLTNYYLRVEGDRYYFVHSLNDKWEVDVVKNSFVVYGDEFNYLYTVGNKNIYVELSDDVEIWSNLETFHYTIGCKDNRNGSSALSFEHSQINAVDVSTLFDSASDGVYIFSDFVLLDGVRRESFIIPSECKEIVINSLCDIEKLVLPKEINCFEVRSASFFKLLKTIYVSKEMSEKSLSVLLLSLVRCRNLPIKRKSLLSYYESMDYDRFLSEMRSQLNRAVVDKALDGIDVVAY